MNKKEQGRFESPFSYDPFALVAEAFKNLYPGKEYTAYWEPNIRDEEDGTRVWGLTDFGDDGSVEIFVSPALSIQNAIEIFAHELAHLAVGVEHDHDDEWEAAFQALFDEYNRISIEVYGLI